MPTPKADPGKPESTRRKPFHETVVGALAPIVNTMSRLNKSSRDAAALLLGKASTLFDLLDGTMVPHDHVAKLIHRLVVLWEEHHEKLPEVGFRLKETIDLLLALMAEQAMEHKELMGQWADLQQQHPTYQGLQ